MRVLRWIGIAIGVVIAGVACVAVVARFSDGPLGPFPGGPLESGRLVAEPVRDWSFVEPVEEVELQLVTPPRSRTVWIVFHGDRAYIPCGAPNFRLWKQWPHQAVADGRAVLRVEGERYRVLLDKIDRPSLEGDLRAALREKYPSAEGYSGTIWFFELRPVT